jgi:DNA (cytosine-5)-methyltransferase 3A
LLNVLSLFDGMACGMLAMQKAGIEVDRYVAYEIDKYAVQTSSHNFPMIEHKGDVFRADFSEYSDFDFLIGGSPCTYWSIAQKNNRETEASGMGWELFSQYVRALHEAKPKFFVYENNKSMSKAIRASIDEAFGFEAICINSALVSAQNRQRLYWVGKRNEDGTYSKVNVEQPEDRGVLLKDVLENGIAWKDKQGTIDANYYKGGNYSIPNKQSGQRMCVAEPVGTTKDGKCYCLTAGYANGSGEKIGNYAAHTLEKGCKSMVAEPVCMRYERSDEAKSVRKQYEAGEIRHGFHELSELHPRTDGKSNTVSTVLKDNPICEAMPIYATPCEWDENGKPIKAISVADGKAYIVYEVKDGQITIKGKQYPIKLADGFYIIRKLTVRECMRLQTVPEWYEFPVSDSQAYKMLGNGWTVDVIAHLLTSAMIGGVCE